MSAFRQPKGSYVRTTGDWFYQNTAIFHASVVRPSGSDPLYFALYNNDTIGRSLFVKDFFLDTTSGGTSWYYAQGLTAVGALVTGIRGCFPLNPLWPAPVGQMYTGANDLPPTFIIFATDNEYLNFPETSGPDVPLYVIPQGWSLVVSTAVGSTGPSSATFQGHYQVING